MNRVIVAVLAWAALSGSAVAADMAPPVFTKAPPLPAPTPVFNWTGCYIGGFAGSVQGNGPATAHDLDSWNLAPDVWSYNMASNFFGGGTLGCNYQVSSFVFGIEAEGGYLRTSGSAIDPLSRFLPQETTRAATTIGDRYAVLAGRAGFASGRTFLYVKGGAALVDTRVSIIDIADGERLPLIQAANGNSRVTWALGGGIEYAFTNNWTIKGEYLYIDTRQTLSTCGLNVSDSGEATFCWAHDVPGLHTAKLGLNYKFDWATPVVARR